MNTRYFGLDFARAVLMLMGIIYHSSLIYIIDSQWHISHPQKSQIFNILSEFIHYFRMNAFYIIAGFFFVLVIEKYETKKILTERIVKLFIPLLVIGFSINNYFNGVHPEYAAMWSFEYIFYGQWVHHLWFIGNLIFYYIFAIFFVGNFTTAKVRAHSLKIIVFFALAVTPTLWILLTWLGMKISPTRVLFLSFETALGYFPYFVLGMYFWGQRDRCFAAMTPSNAMIISMVSLVLIVIMQTVDLKSISWILYLFVNGLTGGVLSIAMIMWLNCIGNKANKLVGKLTDSSYSIYLLHDPLIVFIYVTFLAAIELNIFLSYALLCSAVFIVTYFSHFFLIKKSIVLMLLINGKIPIRKKTHASTKSVDQLSGSNQT